MSFKLSNSEGIAASYSGTVTATAGAVTEILKCKGTERRSTGIQLRGGFSDAAAFFAADSEILVYLGGELIATITDQIYNETLPVFLPQDVPQNRDVVVTMDNKAASDVDVWLYVVVD